MLISDNEWVNGAKRGFFAGLREEDRPFNFSQATAEYLQGYFYGYSIAEKMFCKVDEDGNKVYLNAKGKLHREDGPAIECADGDKFWYLNGKLHREDGPAIECADGSKSWWLNGKRHREDGPAIERTDGYKGWYLNDKKVTEEDVRKLGKMK